MGVIAEIFGFLFGGGRNVLRETAEVFVENSEASAQRTADLRGDVMQQFSQEFVIERKGGFDRFMDGLNRVPRPALALGTDISPTSLKPSPVLSPLLVNSTPCSNT